MAALSGSSITFQSADALKYALEPLSSDDVMTRVSSPTAPIPLKFQYDEDLSHKKIIPLRNPGTGNLLKTEIYHTKALSVFYPETPRVPHHLSIALNRTDIKGIAGVSEEENAELYSTIKKIVEIYKSISIQGFVIAQFDTPQPGHLDRFVVEMIPHLPGFQNIKNIVDKVDCNRHVLFRSANLSPITYEISPEDIQRQAELWKIAFQQQSTPLDDSEGKVSFPYIREECYLQEANQLLYHQLIQLLEDKGGYTAEEKSYTARMPTEAPEAIKSITVDECQFCKDSVIERQHVYQYGEVEVFYNMRKSPKEGTSFLILPKRHVEKVYALTAQEINDLFIVRKALVEVLKDTHPDHEVVVYTQDDPAVGQTVFHSHEQIVAIDPKSIALTWTMMSLYPTGTFSPEEMLKVREEFDLKMQQKMKEFTIPEKAA